MRLLSTAGIVLLGLVLIAGTLSPMGIFAVHMSDVAADEDEPGWFTRHRGRLYLASALVSFTSIVLGAYLLGSSSSSDEARHCAPGTRYVAQDRLVGKSIEHDWVCTPT